MNPEKRITEFFKSHHVLTIATSASNQAWCANCFYVYLPEENLLSFTSDLKTRHIQEGILNKNIAGSVVLETRIIGKIQGIQFMGCIEEPQGKLAEKVKNAYLKRFPVAMLMDTTMWIVRLTYIKMTDNRLGFGKKLIWESDSSIS
jgi:uncharacterized protein YhbP (UPF0306 family)